MRVRPKREQRNDPNPAYGGRPSWRSPRSSEQHWTDRRPCAALASDDPPDKPLGGRQSRQLRRISRGPVLSRSLPDPTYFALSGFIYLQIELGVDSFTCYVCLPRWLLDHFEEMADTYSPEETNCDESRWRPEGEPIAFFSPGMILMSLWSEQIFRFTPK